MLALLSIIVLVIDVQSKSPRIEANGYKVSYFLVHYYPYFIVYLIVTFMSILVFISVIFFTSRLANNTEVVAIISSGASFHRFARPYLITAGFIALVTLFVNHFALPWSNYQKNKLEAYTYNEKNREQILGNATISTQLSKTEYIFINSYNRQGKRGSGYVYQKFDNDKRLVHQIIGAEVSWDEKARKFVITNFLDKKLAKNDAEVLSSGATTTQDFHHGPEELFPDQLLGQTKTTPELLNFIQREKDKGNGNLNTYLNELYQRTAMPFSIIILTVLALALSSEKKRGGIGLNLALGIALAFVFVFSFQFLSVVSENKTLPPMLAMWLPNIVFSPLALFLYFRRANQ